MNNVYTVIDISISTILSIYRMIILNLTSNEENELMISFVNSLLGFIRDIPEISKSWMIKDYLELILNLFWFV